MSRRVAQRRDPPPRWSSPRFFARFFAPLPPGTQRVERAGLTGCDADTYIPARFYVGLFLSAHDYHFLSRWRIEGADPADAYDALADEPQLPRWWPAVSLSVEVLEPGDADGVGRQVDLHMKGWLPYTLRWQYRVVEAVRPSRRVLEAHGDFVGLGIWSFEREDSATRVSFDWELSVQKPMVKALSFALKPLFAANHRWAMARGEESLRIEVARRHARTPQELACIPAPPGPTFRFARGKVALP